MKIRDLRSIIVIFVYITINFLITYFSLKISPTETAANNSKGSLAPHYTIIESLDYFNIKDGVPQMSLSADKMNSQGENYAEFANPKGVFNYKEKSESVRYRAMKGVYMKGDESILLEDQAEILSSDSQYFANKVEYYMKKDLVIGTGDVKFQGEDLKTKDQIVIESNNMTAHPEKKTGHFVGNVRGSMTRKKKYEGKMDFRSNELMMDGIKSFAHLEGDVWLKRGGQQVTSGKADMYLENFNKQLKYFVLNDDVKVTEKLSTPVGTTERKAFAERLEGYGREQKMILSGAPRVEQGADVIKGYRITIRENVDLVEVDDAMSDMKVKKNEKRN